jgi:hypothetical protein
MTKCDLDLRKIKTVLCKLSYCGKIFCQEVSISFHRFKDNDQTKKSYLSLYQSINHRGGVYQFTCRLYGHRQVCSRNRDNYLLHIGFPRVKISFQSYESSAMCCCVFWSRSYLKVERYLELN